RARESRRALRPVPRRGGADQRSTAPADDDSQRPCRDSRRPAAHASERHSRRRRRSDEAARADRLDAPILPRPNLARRLRRCAAPRGGRPMSVGAYFEMIGGASGNMILGALVDAGADLDAIEGVLRTIPVEGWTVV